MLRGLAGNAVAGGNQRPATTATAPAFSKAGAVVGVAIQKLRLGFLRTAWFLGRGSSFSFGLRGAGLAGFTGFRGGHVLVREHRVHLPKRGLQAAQGACHLFQYALQVSFNRVGLLRRFYDFLELIKI